MAEEEKNIQAEQISQNYLIDPEDLLSGEQQEESSLGDFEYPESDRTTIANQLDDSDFIVNQNKSPDTVKSTPPAEMESVKKDMSGLKDIVNKSVNPSIENLYKMVSALANKNPDPKSFTEQRTAFSSGFLFFNKEESRVSQPIDWA
jgi:hypothetical protein